MSEEERKLYDVLFPNDSNPNFINYAYFRGGSVRSLSLLRSKIRKSQIEPILVEDDIYDGAFFVRILEKDVDAFISMVKTLRYKQFRIPKRCIDKVQQLFGDN